MRYFLELCLKSVIAAVKDLDAEIIVVDNKSSDASCSMVKDQFPNVVLIENNSNLGFSKGNNIGVDRAKGEYICILNPDTVVAEDTFSSLLRFADSKRNLGAVGCKLIDGAGCFLPESKRNIPTPKVAFQKILGNTESYYANQVSKEKIAPVDVLVGAIMLMKKEVYLKVDGLDEDYFMYGEDVDLSYKIIKAGFNNFYFGKTTIIHYKGESTLRNRQYAKRFNGAMKIFYQKHFQSSKVLEFFLNLGIYGLTVLNIQPKVEEVKVNAYLLVSDTNRIKLKNKLSKPTQIVSEIQNVQDFQQVILDNSTLSFKKIIAIMEEYQFNSTISYRIIPHNANFAVGSDNAVSRGEVIHF